MTTLDHILLALQVASPLLAFFAGDALLFTMALKKFRNSGRTYEEWTLENPYRMLPGGGWAAWAKYYKL